MTITTYGELLSLLDDMGFIAFGGRTGIPNLADVTRADAWHTGQDTDPWEWKRMLSERRDGIYTRVEGGQALFISHAWHPVFIAAYTPALPLEERWEMGQVSQAVWEMHRLFLRQDTWAKHDLRARAPEKGFHGALERLMAEMEIVMSGESQRLSVDLRPVGWPSIEYMRTDVYAPEAVARAAQLDAEEARLKIITQRGKIAAL
ncbi:MAG TPA: hypothetical protein IAA64_04240 [Candidatus Ornithocaccomicrobium faecavium]|uniref:Uncharacterized protein n=1 Tax=Candidatus Ornithocaccomicrobium faecavium TaxID=2840890 RepID=A0A9D1P5S8_9FIRM|nr:hypothetical protein [Candidatus Ornithocaccomicrobium faecavium]